MKNKIIFLLIFISSLCFSQKVSHVLPDEMHPMIEKALQGDAKAANELSLYYEFYQKNYSAEDNDLTLYWLLIAAENDTDGFFMKELSSYLISTNPDSKDRGLYWLYMSSQRGNKEAKKDIKNIYSKYNFRFADDAFYSSLEVKNLDDYKSGALRGSGNAAYSLSNYYKSSNDFENYIFWLRIGAQNGNVKCINEYAEFLRKSSDRNDNIRAKFWGAKVKS